MPRILSFDEMREREVAEAMETLKRAEGALFVKGYESLQDVLGAAVDQASTGKGKERHAESGVPFEEQWIARLAPLSFTVGQACKKAIESLRMSPERAELELLGAINYLAAEVLRRRKERK